MLLACRGIGVIVALVSLFPGLAFGQEVELRTIVVNVRANEELFKDIDVSHQRTYEQNAAAAAPAVAKATLEEECRTVFQGDFLYRSEKIKTIQLSDKAPKLFSTLLGYDGEFTRRLDEHAGGRVANLNHGRLEDALLFRPHTWILIGSEVYVPLSVWLEGGDRLAKHPLAGNYKDYDLSASLVGSESVAGLGCFKLKCELRTRDKEREMVGLWYLWLAQDKNYLPGRTHQNLHNYCQALDLGK